MSDRSVERCFVFEAVRLVLSALSDLMTDGLADLGGLQMKQDDCEAVLK